ncbi:MAG: type I-E CRISPR-associated protein Cas7/Cse4/CasC [Armatimonadota bacterium]|nr:type I-E CRISPR-associated protein Cas7/Cse4/CasC [Armatimonadota bacterium]
MNLVEVHILQPVPPANLNRDDTGSPKDTLFGGFRRARISSQAQKRAVRQYFSNRELLSPEDRAVRTRLLVDELVTRFQDRPPEQVRRVAAAALRAIGLVADEATYRTQYLLFLGNREIDTLARALKEHWEALLTASATLGPQSKKDKKNTARQGAPETVRNALNAILDGGRAVDVALFGRMLADRPEWGVEAACQVAHAISTHRVDREFDFYTAVDDLAPREETGAGMMGDVEYYTATFYRYANVDLELLAQNLRGDRDLAARGVEAFLRAFILTLPSGKQNTFAAHSPPKFVGLIVRENGMPRNLAAAFERPVRPTDGKSLTGVSVEVLTRYWAELDRVYGKPAKEWVALVNLSDGELAYYPEARKNTIEDVIQAAMSGVRALLGTTA